MIYVTTHCILLYRYNNPDNFRGMRTDKIFGLRGPGAPGPYNGNKK